MTGKGKFGRAPRLARDRARRAETIGPALSGKDAMDNPALFW
ncbi:hypothetical protein BV133_2061 [Blastochloris viridis]|uniref:Uncharacterized protein n=1 Tax=Blastochloris viridis TaxID=1079 RepID=A0A182D2L5_BLAVI|nr:hypothetical protein BV133_2061 [Blastochloris viridis]